MMKNLPLALTLSTALAGLAFTGLAAPASAQSAGDWTLGIGVHNVAPASNNGSLAGGALDVDVGSNAQPTITFEYFLRDNLGVEVLGALPFKHSVSIDGLGKVGSVKQLPPVISLQYHFANASKVTPFVGLGINYTAFFSEKTTGALAGNNLKLEDSWGLAAHAGLDYAINANNALRVDARWIDIDSDVKLNGTKIGKVKIDPLALGVAFVHRF